MSARHRQQKRRIKAIESALDHTAGLIFCYERVAADLVQSRRVVADGITISVLTGTLNILRNDHYVLSRDLETAQNYLASMPKRKAAP